MNSKLRILHLVPKVGKTSFGLGPVVLNLAAYQQISGHMVNVWCFDEPSEIPELESNHMLIKNTIRSFPMSRPRKVRYSPAMEREISQNARTFDIVHQHGIWTGISRALNCWRARTKRPTVITPHGSLEPYALKRSRWKKRLAMMLYERKNLFSVSCMQALSEREANDFRAFGIRCPIAVIPNGASEAWINQCYKPENFRRRYNLPNDVRIMLYLGRITPKKGLPMLLYALHNCREHLDNWVLIIAGVNEFNHEQEVRALVNKLELQTHVQFVGPQFGQDKRDAYGAADLFVLPSHSEGAPVVILEALGAGVPVFTTQASPWEELITEKCGWWTDISVDAITDGLQDALRKPRHVLKDLGECGKRLVQEKYTWSQVTKEVINLYYWLCESGRPPSFLFRK